MVFSFALFVVGVLISGYTLYYRNLPSVNELSEEESKVVDLLTLFTKPVTARKISERGRYDVSHVRRVLKGLHDKGVVLRLGAGIPKSPYMWILLDKKV